MPLLAVVIVVVPCYESLHLVLIHMFYLVPGTIIFQIGLYTHTLPLELCDITTAEVWYSISLLQVSEINSYPYMSTTDLQLIHLYTRDYLPNDRYYLDQTTLTIHELDRTDAWLHYWMAKGPRREPCATSDVAKRCLVVLDARCSRLQSNHVRLCLG